MKKFNLIILGLFLLSSCNDSSQPFLKEKRYKIYIVFGEGVGLTYLCDSYDSYYLRASNCEDNQAQKIQRLLLGTHLVEITDREKELTQ
jgi:hypothetical protein